MPWALGAVHYNANKSIEIKLTRGALAELVHSDALLLILCLPLYFCVELLGNQVALHVHLCACGVVRWGWEGGLGGGAQGWQRGVEETHAKVGAGHASEPGALAQALGAQHGGHLGALALL